MKVILNQTVPKVGKQWQVVTVKDGFARNYLFPRGLAIYADKNQLAALEKRLARVVEKEAGDVAAAETLREKLNGQRVRIEGKVGAAAGKLFGSVTSQDVVDAIQSQLGVALDKKQVALIDPIKRLGEHRVELDLHRQVDAILTVEVYDPNAPVEAPAEPKAEAAPVAEAEPEAPADEDVAEPVEA